MIMKKALILLFFVVPLLGFPQRSNVADSLKRALTSAKEDTTVCKLMIQLGDSFVNNQPDSALTHYDNALEIALNKKSEKFRAVALQKIGVVHYYKGDYARALDFYKRSLHLHRSINNLKGISNCYNNMGIIYGVKGIYDKTLEYFLKSLAIDIELGDPKQISYSYNNIGNVYQSMDDPDKAKEYFEKALYIQQDINDENGLLAVYSNLGSIANKTGDYQTALDYFQKGLEIARRVEKVGVPSFYTNLGIVHSNLEQYDTAENYFKRSLSLYQQVGDKFGMAKTLAQMAMTQTKHGEYRLAIENGEKGLRMAREIEAVPLQMEAAESLFNAWEGLNNYPEALHYHKLFKLYSDSIFNLNHTRQIHNIQAGSDLLSKEKENEILKQKNKINELELARQKSIRNFFIALSVLVIALIIFSYNRNRIKRKANRELTRKNELITLQKEQLKAAIADLKTVNQQLELQKNEIEQQAKALKISESKLTNQRQHLEVLVEERTHELKEKVDELEKYHDLFVQREFRIKELKDQLRDLRRNISEN